MFVFHSKHQKVIASVDIDRFLPVIEGHLHFEWNEQKLLIKAGTIVEVLAEEAATNDACQDFHVVQDQFQAIKLLKASFIKIDFNN